MASLRNIATIAGKELRGYFASPMAWVTLGLFAVLFGYFYNVTLVYFIQSSMQASQFGAPAPANVNTGMIGPLLNNASVLMLFLLPMVTMRTYSEEKRSGTMELLLTAPITDPQIILGKFLGAIGLYAALLAVTVLYVGALFFFGHPEIRTLVSGYIGLFLLGSCFIALGLFISSTTPNLMVAGAATFVVSLMFWIVSWFSSYTSSTTADILNYLSLTEHLSDFAKGVIDTKHVVYYLSFIGFSLFLTLKSVDSERWRG